MCVQGYSDAAGSYDRQLRTGARWGFVFHVVDLVECSRVVAKFKASGKQLDEDKVQAARLRAQQLASRLNKQDRAHDRVLAH